MSKAAELETSMKSLVEEEAEARKVAQLADVAARRASWAESIMRFSAHGTQTVWSLHKRTDIFSSGDNVSLGSVKF